MSASELPLASVVVSVDLAESEQDSPLLEELLDLLHGHRIPALWSLAFEQSSAAAARIRVPRLGHEFGLLTSSDWAGPAVSRTEFGHELSRRVDQAVQQGVSLTALSLRDIDPPEHFDLLVKYQIPLLRTRTDCISGATNSLQPRLARFGIWQTEPTIVVPVVSRWSLPWTARRLLQQACDRGQTLHISIAGDRLSRLRAAGLASLDYLLKLTNARRERGQLEVISLGQLLRMYAPRRDQRGSRSILRAA